MKLGHPSTAERATARTQLAALVERHGTQACAAHALGISFMEATRTSMGAASRRSTERLRVAFAALPRCVECGGVLHANWPDARCAGCQTAVVAQVDARSVDGSYAAWAARRAS